MHTKCDEGYQEIWWPETGLKDFGEVDEYKNKYEEEKKL